MRVVVADTKAKAAERAAERAPTQTNSRLKSRPTAPANMRTNFS